jgi:hypothetical protein
MVISKLDTINIVESAIELFKKQNDLSENEMEIIDGIKTKFLGMILNPKIGFHISLEEYANWMGNPKIYENYKNKETGRRDFRRRYLRDPKFMLKEAKNKDEIGKDFIIIKDDNNIGYPWFTTLGFKRLAMFSNEPKSNYVRYYYTLIETEYIEAIQSTEEENAKRFAELEKKIIMYEEKYEKQSDLRLKYEDENAILKAQIDLNANLIYILDDKDDFASTGNPEFKEFAYYQMKYGHKIHIYVVDVNYVVPKPKTIRSVKKSEPAKKGMYGIVFTSDEEEAEVPEVEYTPAPSKKIDYSQYDLDLEYDYKSFNKYNISEEDGGEQPILYIYIDSPTGTRYKSEKKYQYLNYAGNFYVPDKDVYKEMKNTLNTIKDNYGVYLHKTPRKDIFKISHRELMGIKHAAASNLTKALLC